MRGRQIQSAARQLSRSNSRSLRNVAEAGSTRQKPPEKRSLQAVNEHFPAGKFSLYFLAAVDSNALDTWSDDPVERTHQTFGRPAMLELTHNWGTEDEPEFSYHNGNEDPRGFGHIGFAVPDLEAACARFEELGVSFVKRPQDGKMHNIAFIRDPDGYWIEIFAPGGMA